MQKKPKRDRQTDGPTDQSGDLTPVTKLLSLTMLIQFKTAPKPIELQKRA